MRHPSDADLLLFHYEGGRRTSAHVEACSHCRARVAQFRELLDAIDRAPVPARDESYGRAVWSRIAPRLSERRAASSGWRSFFALRPLAVAGGVAALLLVGFLAGRLVPGRPRALSPEVRERILLVDLSEHLERSQAVLIELVHAPEEEGGADISREQARATELLAANRLYRQSARRAGEAGVAGVLDDLERVLLEVAHGPSRASAADLAQLRDRIQAQGVLFRVRVIGTTVREREESRRAFHPSERKTL